jgi:hypothetical protein
MRPSSIISISALAAGSLASGAQHNADDVDYLLTRTIDHEIMDPARLSVLSVLQNAIASGNAFPRPTGDFEPEWYEMLPEEIKRILPSLYPAAAADVSVSLAMSVSVFASVTTFEAVLESHLPVPTASPILATFTPFLRTLLAVSAILTRLDQTTTVVPASTSNSPSTSQVTLTKTLQHVPSGTAVHDLPSNASSSTALDSTNGTALPASPSPSAPVSGSARTVMRVEKLAGLAWIGLAAGFFLFA